jgi:hypothetical protein
MHVIRLRMPWSKTVDAVDGSREVNRVDVPDVSDSTLVPAKVAIQKPGRVQKQGTDPDPCRVRYRRRFNRPSGLVGQRVFLRISGWQGQLESLQLNGVEIPICAGDASIEADVASLLERHNELIVSLWGNPQVPPSLTGEVVLAIDE